MTNGRHRPPEPLDRRVGRLAGWVRIRQETVNGSRWMLLVAAGVGLCTIATGVSLAAFSSPGDQSGHTVRANNGPPPATARAAQPMPPVVSSSTGSSVTSAGIAKTALQYPPGLKNQILRWTAGRGGTAWSAVTAQLGNATQAGAMRLFSDLRMECASLASSVWTARSAPPIPDEVMERSYARVLVGLSNTAADCQNAISLRPQGDEGQRIDVNKALLDQSLAQFAAESRELYTATAEIRTLRR